MKHLPLVATLCLAASPLAYVATAQAGDDIGDVLLSSGGLAQIVKHVEVASGQTEISLDIPLDQADDILKSLVVSDPAGAVASVTIAGTNAVAEAFRHMPFTRADLASTAAIAAAMTGHRATVDDGAGHIESGAILGVATVQHATAGQPINLPAVTLQRADGSFAEVLLPPGASILFSDPDIQARIETAIAAIRTAANQNFRTIRIATTAGDQRTVDLSYVVAAPVWKATYRVVPGDAGKYRVQGWAVLENGTGDDWTNVRLTLSSSNPVALKQRLSDMYWRDRREVPIMLPGGAVQPLLDHPGDAEPEMLGMAAPAAPMMAMADTAAPGGRMMKAGAPALMPAPARGPAAVASEGDVGITFTLPQPVTLTAGATLTVPIIDADFDADLVSMWRADAGSDHPQAAIFLANGSGQSVPPGIFTIFGRDGYVGDAQVAGIPPGEKRFAAFAADAKTRIASERSDAATLTGLKARDGVLTLTRALSWTTVYHLTAPSDADRTIMIDHDRVDGASVSSNGEVVSTDPATLRLRLPVAAGQSADLTVTEKKTEAETVAIGDSEPDQLLVYASTAGIEPAMADKLKLVAALKGKVAGLARAVDKAEQSLARFNDEQERLRANLKAVPETSDLAKTYMSKLDRSEKAIDKTEAERAAAQGDLEKAQADLGTAITRL